MPEEKFEIENSLQKTAGARDYLGFILVICGLSIAFWVFINVYSLFTEPEKLTPFQELVSGHLETTISDAERKDLKIVIPKEILSYLVPIILLTTAGGIAGLLVTGGIRLLDGDVQRLSRKMTTIGNKLTTKMNGIQNTLRKNR